MSGIKCTKCGNILNTTQAIAQIITKTARDAFQLNSIVQELASASILASFLAGCATESKIKCPECNSEQGFVPVSK
jgi:ribosomal protein S26